MAKSPEAFRTISEAADEVGVPQHVLRFWETKFSFIRPMKRAGGRRFYRPQDIALLREVRRLLHDEGLTIKGVQKLHRDKGVRRMLGGEAAPGAVEADLDRGPVYDEGLFDAEPEDEMSPEARRRLSEALDALEAAKARLDELLKG